MVMPLHDPQVTDVNLHFSFTNANVIPAGVRSVPEEAEDKRKKRLAALPATPDAKILESTKRCSLSQFVAELEGAGYALADAFHQKREYLDGRKGGYHIARFAFRLPQTDGIPSDASVGDVEHTALARLCREAFWRPKAYCRKTKQGNLMLDIALHTRQPLVNVCGDTITEWVKDESKKRIGSGPVPIVPDTRLRIVDDAVCLI